MWNFSFRPQYTDDADIRYVEVSTNGPGNTAARTLEHFTVEHFAFHNNVGRTEVPPVATDPEATGPESVIASAPIHFSSHRNCTALALTGSAISVRWSTTMSGTSTSAAPPRPCRGTFRRHSPARGRRLPDPCQQPRPGLVFRFLGKDRNLRRQAPRHQTDARFSTRGENVPAKACEFDNHRTVCPEAWEMRELYIIEANAKALSWHKRIGSGGVTIPKRVLYIDSEGWFITGSEQYDRDGKLWKTIATFNTYRDRPIPDDKTAIYPFKRMFRSALVDENLRNGYSSVIYMPGHESEDQECWYVNMGIVTKAFLDPHQAVVTSY